MKLVSTAYSLYSYFVSTYLVINRDYHHPPTFSKNISALEIETFILNVKCESQKKINVENWEEI